MEQLMIFIVYQLAKFTGIFAILAPKYLQLMQTTYKGILILYIYNCINFLYILFCKVKRFSGVNKIVKWFDK